MGHDHVSERFKLISEDEDAFMPPVPPGPPDRIVSRFLGDWGRHIVRMPKFTEAAVIEVLSQITRDIRERFQELINEDGFELSFKIGKKSCSEIAFFKRIVKENLRVVPELRELLSAYLATQPDPMESKGSQIQLWGPKDFGALGPAMEALLQLDPSAIDIFREYLARRDGEHETYSSDVMMKAFVRKSGWKNGKRCVPGPL